MTDNGFVRVVGHDGTTKNGMYAKWTFALRPDGTVLAVVGVRLSVRHDWHEIARRSFAHGQDQILMRDWVRSVLAPHNALRPDAEDGAEPPPKD